MGLPFNLQLGGSLAVNIMYITGALIFVALIFEIKNGTLFSGGVGATKDKKRVTNPGTLPGQLETVVSRGIETGQLDVELELKDEKIKLFGKNWTAKIKTPTEEKKKLTRAERRKLKREEEKNEGRPI